MEENNVVENKKSIFNNAVKELVAIGAAIGSNCEMCLKYHFNEAMQLGISKEDIQNAIDMACKVKQTPANSILNLAEKLCDKKATISGCGCNSTEKNNKCC